jgi:AraC-like DNA-binding protein
VDNAASSAGPGGSYGDLYPWAREHEALAALAEFDLGRCRAALERLATEVRLTDGAKPGSMALLLANLLEAVRSSLQPGERHGNPGDDHGRAERWRRAKSLGSAENMGTLRKRFQQEIELLFAPLVSGATVSPTVLRARAYLDHHFTRRITLSELAKAIHLSPNYLSSIFRRELGVTVTQYLRQRRMRLAEQLLMEGKHTISEVAYRVGYQNYRDFHRNFVREEKRSPRAFQRLCRSNRKRLQGDPSPPHRQPQL